MDLREKWAANGRMGWTNARCILADVGVMISVMERLSLIAF